MSRPTALGGKELQGKLKCSWGGRERFQRGRGGRGDQVRRAGWSGIASGSLENRKHYAVKHDSGEAHGQLELPFGLSQYEGGGGRGARKLKIRGVR